MTEADREAPKKPHSQHRWSAKHSGGRRPFLTPDLETEPVEAIYGKFADTFFLVFGRIFPSPVKVKGSTGGEKKNIILLVSTYFIGCFMAGVTN